MNLRRRQPFPIPYAAQNCPIPNGNMLRKPACHFGWDWNLAIAPLGVYGAIALQADAAGADRACADRPAASRRRLGVGRRGGDAVRPRGGRRAADHPLCRPGTAARGRDRRRETASTPRASTIERPRPVVAGRRRRADALPARSRLRRRCGPPPHRAAQAGAADRPGRGRRALRLPRQRPRDCSAAAPTGSRPTRCRHAPRRN